MKKLLVLVGVCFALLTAFPIIHASAHPPCGRVWVEGHHDRYGRWVPPHWKHLHWVGGHYGRHGHWIEGHCE